MSIHYLRSRDFTFHFTAILWKFILLSQIYGFLQLGADVDFSVEFRILIGFDGINRFPVNGFMVLWFTTKPDEKAYWLTETAFSFMRWGRGCQWRVGLYFCTLSQYILYGSHANIKVMMTQFPPAYIYDIFQNISQYFWDFIGFLSWYMFWICLNLMYM